MKEVKSSYKILGECPTDINEALKRIEIAGRTAYQSQNKITADSAQKFVAMITKKKHLAVIEHSALTVKIDKEGSILENLFPYHHPHHLIEEKDHHIYISSNFRAWLELSDMPQNLFKIVNNYLSPLMYGPTYPVSPGIYQIVTDQKEIPSGLKRISVKFVLPRGLSHEIIRHRPCSFLQESTRYCRYNNISVVEPPGLNAYQNGVWKEAMLQAESAYTELLKTGTRPEIARAVLPIGLKTEIMVTASAEEWSLIFGLRTASSSHPEMRALMIPLKEEFLANGWYFPRYACCHCAV